MQSTIDKILHVGLLVEDLEQAVSYYEELGFGPFDVFRSEGPSGVFMNGFQLDEKVSPGVAFFYTPGAVLEIVEAGEVGPYREWIDANGPGLHHLSVSTEDYEGLCNRCNEITGGRKLFIEGHQPKEDGTDVRFSYIDMRPEIGAVLEVGEFHENPES